MLLKHQDLQTPEILFCAAQRTRPSMVSGPHTKRRKTRENSFDFSTNTNRPRTYDIESPRALHASRGQQVSRLPVCSPATADSTDTLADGKTLEDAHADGRSNARLQQSPTAKKRKTLLGSFVLMYTQHIFHRVLICSPEQ